MHKAPETQVKLKSRLLPALVGLLLVMHLSRLPGRVLAICSY
jgi:hypothetical protein